jgi:hypothetical protein
MKKTSPIIRNVVLILNPKFILVSPGIFAPDTLTAPEIYLVIDEYKRSI